MPNSLFRNYKYFTLSIELFPNLISWAFNIHSHSFSFQLLPNRLLANQRCSPTTKPHCHHQGWHFSLSLCGQPVAKFHETINHWWRLQIKQRAHMTHFQFTFWGHFTALFVFAQWVNVNSNIVYGYDDDDHPRMLFAVLNVWVNIHQVRENVQFAKQRPKCSAHQKRSFAFPIVRKFYYE